MTVGGSISTKAMGSDSADVAMVSPISTSSNAGGEADDVAGAAAEFTSPVARAE
jgi:hypothetical protein